MLQYADIIVTLELSVCVLGGLFLHFFAEGLLRLIGVIDPIFLVKITLN